MQMVLGLIGIGLILALIVGYFRLQFVALINWRGPAGYLAALPLIVWTSWLFMFLRDLNRDPTSHNLFPFEMAMIAAASGLYLLVLMGVRHFLRAA